MRVSHLSTTATALCFLGCAGNEGLQEPAWTIMQPDDANVLLAWQCPFMAAGMLPSGDRFGGSVHPLASGGIAGAWHHVTAGGDRFEAETFERLSCISDGGGSAGRPVPTPNRADLDGTGRWNGVGGHVFRVHVEDRGEPTVYDNYILVVLAPDGSVVLDARGFVTEGEVQMLGEAAPAEP